MSNVRVPSSLAGQHVLVLGHGISGQALARWWVRCGAKVTLADTRHQPEVMAQLAQQMPQVNVISAPFDDALMAQQQWAAIGKSPGLSPAQISTVTQWANANQVPLWGELDVFAQGLQSVYTPYGWAPKLLAITGTNGKTTTTVLTGLLVERAGFRVAVAGNIGTAMLDALGQALDAQTQADPTPPTDDADATPPQGQTLPQVWVLELSSFQLDGVTTGAQGFEPHAATVLNITEDHLDWHGNMAHYAAAKQRVYGQSGIMLLNRDDPQVMQAKPAAVVPTKGKKTALDDAPAARQWVSFGLDVPTRAGDWGLETIHGMTWLVQAQAADETRQRKRRQTQDEPEDLVLQRLMPAEALRIRGRHNATNALAALALATSVGAKLAPMLHGLREYQGEAHRVEPVCIINEVEYFDDSKGTNVGATLAAIRGLGAERRLVLIMGGEGKGQDFAPLAPAVRAHVQAVVLMGRDAPLLRQALAATGVPLMDAATLPQAVELAASQAQSGHAVLLSPACASFDMFDSYIHRAAVFTQAVQQLAIDKGQA